MLAYDISIHLDGDAGALAGWPGPRFAVVPPDRRVDEDDLRRIEETVRVVEILDGPHGVARVLSVLFDLAPGVSVRPSGPFLYAGRGVTAAEVDAWAGAVAEDPLAVVLEERPGRGNVVALGDGIVSHRNLPLMLARAAGRWQGDRAFCDLLRDGLEGRGA